MMNAKFTLLLVEPDKMLASTYIALFKDVGYLVWHSPTIEHAIQTLDKTKIDLIILEFQIALHNGLEFIYEMRSYPEWQQIPIIAHTLVSREQLRITDEIQEMLGISSYLYKPTTTLEKLKIEIDKQFSLVV